MDVISSAVAITARDDPHSDVAFLKIYFVPNEMPAVQFYTFAQERESRSLLDRQTKVLDSEVIVIPPTGEWERSEDDDE